MIPGTVRIRGASLNPEFPMSPQEVIAEVSQTDGTWVKLRICSITVEIQDGQPVTAHVTVEPNSVELGALLGSIYVRNRA